MAVEIIGSDDSAKKKTTCFNCASILLYTNADTTMETHRDYSGSSDTYRYIKCPKCGSKINLGPC